MRNLLLIIFSILLLAACTNSALRTQHSALAKADSLMHTHPDSALALLQSISADSLTDEANRAYHALLLSQALDKNYIDKTDDSLINIAVAYYAKRKLSREYFLSLYYKGRILRNAGEYPKAMLAYVEAEKYKDFPDNAYLVGLLYKQLGNLHYEYSDYPKSLSAYELASTYFAGASKNQHYAFCLYDIANVYRQMLNIKASEKMYLKAMDKAKTISYTYLYNASICGLFMLYVEFDMQEKADSLYRSNEDLLTSTGYKSAYYASLAKYYATIHDDEKSDYYMNEACDKAINLNDSITLFFKQSEISADREDYSQAYNKLSKAIVLQDSIVKHTLQLPLQSVQQELLSVDLRYKAYLLRVEKYIQVCMIIIFILILCCIYYYVHKKNKEKKDEIQKYIDTIFELQRICKQETAQSKNIYELFKNQFNTINQLCKAYTQNADCELEKKLIVENSNHIISSFKKNISLAELEEIANRYNDNLLSQLKTHFSISDSVYQQLCYHAVGLSINTISVLTGDKTDTIYKRRNRVRKMILDSSVENKERYLSLLFA